MAGKMEGRTAGRVVDVGEGVGPNSAVDGSRIRLSSALQQIPEGHSDTFVIRHVSLLWGEGM